MKSHPVIAGIYRVALICGAGPLVAGTSIFLLWLATGWDWLPIAGMINVYAGIFLFTAGVCVLTYHCWHSRQLTDLPRRRFWIAVLICFVVMLVNFPAALGIMAMVLKVMDAEYVVAIDNQSNMTLAEARITGGGVDIDYGEFPPHSEVLKRFWIKHDGALHFEATSNDRKLETQIDSYVTRYQGSHKYVTINGDGALEVTDIPYRD